MTNFIRLFAVSNKQKNKYIFIKTLNVGNYDRWVPGYSAGPLVLYCADHDYIRMRTLSVLVEIVWYSSHIISTDNSQFQCTWETLANFISLIAVLNRHKNKYIFIKSLNVGNYDKWVAG